METTQLPPKEKIREKWGALTDGDLEGIASQRVPLAGKLQERYGFGKEQAEREAAEFLRLHPESHAPAQAPPPPTFMTPPPPAAPSPPFISSMPVVSDRPVVQATATHHATLWISPRLLRWSVRLAAVALVALLFFPWTGAYPAGYGVYTQNAFQMIWGGLSVDPVGAKALDPLRAYGDVPRTPLMLLYVLLALLALVMVAAPSFLTQARLERTPRFLRFLAHGRAELLAVVSLAALLLLIVQLGIGFGFDQAISATADNRTALPAGTIQTPEEQETASIRRALELGPLNARHTIWLRLAITANAVLLVSAGLQYWLKRRGQRPLPHIEAIS